MKRREGQYIRRQVPRESPPSFRIVSLRAPFYLVAAMACSTPPTILQMRISQGHAPPCRFRASLLVTVANHRFVTGRLSRHAMSGEKMNRIITVTTDQ